MICFIFFRVLSFMPYFVFFTHWYIYYTVVLLDKLFFLSQKPVKKATFDFFKFPPTTPSVIALFRFLCFISILGLNDIGECLVHLRYSKETLNHGRFSYTLLKLTHFWPSIYCSRPAMFPTRHPRLSFAPDCPQGSVC